MTWSKIGYIFSIFSIVGLIFVVGLFAGNRTLFNSNPDQISVSNFNGANENIFSKVSSRGIMGRVSPVETKRFGEIIYKANGRDKLDIIIRMTNVPINYNTTTGPIPFLKSYQILLAKRTIDGTGYVYTDEGVLSMDEAKNGVYSGSFTKTIDVAQYEFENIYEGIFFYSSPDRTSQLPAYDNKSFPESLRVNPAPYFWTEPSV